MLPNPGARAMELQEGSPEAVKATPVALVENKVIEPVEVVEIGTPELTVEEMNSKLEEFGEFLREEPQLRKGDIVILNDLANALTVNFPIKEGQRAMVALFGNDVKAFADTPFSNTVIRFISGENRIETVCLSSMYLEKVRVVLTKKQIKK